VGCQLGLYPFVVLPGREIPNWFSHQTIGSSISFRGRPLLEGKIRHVLLCAVYAVNKEAPRDRLARGGRLEWKWRLCNKSSRDQSNDWNVVPLARVEPDFYNFEDHIHAIKMADYMPMAYFRPKGIERLPTESGDEIEVAVHLQMWDQGSIYNSKKCEIDSQIVEVKRCGIHLCDL
jgi:hypothetical protein